MCAALHSFPRDHRIKRQSEFARLTRTGNRDVRGPLIIHALASESQSSRLGIRISRRCGTAPIRNRIKRLLREAFRLSQRGWPSKLDLIITVKPHEPLTLDAYQSLLASSIERLSRKVAERA